MAKDKDKAIQKIDMIEVTPQKKTAQQLKNNLSKKYAGQIVMASEKESIKRIPTGILELDNILQGGVVCGKVHLISGAEASFKSSICLKVIVEAQKRGGVCAWVDAERAANKVWMKSLGVNLEELILLEPTSAEAAYDMMTNLINDGVDVIVLDSINTLVVKKEMYADDKQTEAASVEKVVMGNPQKMASLWFRTAFGRIEKSKTVLLVIAQQRDNLNAGMYGNPNVISGGRALKYASSISIQTRQIGGQAGKIYSGNDIVGQKFEAKVEKSRFSKPGLIAQFDVYGALVDNITSMLKVGQEKGFIERIGTKTYYCNGRTFNGKGALIKALYDEKKLFEYCMQKIEESYEDKIFSFNPHSKSDVEAKEEAKIAAKEYVPTDEDGIQIPEDELELEDITEE